MTREPKNQLRKKIQNYSYGLNDQIELAKKGKFFKGINQTTEERVAIQVIDLRNKQSDPGLKEQIAVEIEALRKLKHPNIIRCLDIFSTINNCYIITQFCEGGDLQNRMKTRGAFKQAEALVPFKDLITGYLTIVHQKFIHGGLKLSSLLLKQNALKITGFTNCKKITKLENKRQVPFNSYQSPQSIKQNLFNHKSDIWSLGMILYVLLHGNFPWSINQASDVLQNFTKPYSIHSEISVQATDFINRCLLPATNRLSIQQLPSHPLIKKLFFNYSPQKYILGVKELIQPRIKKQHQTHQPNHLTKVERNINCQINWMRFLFRVMQRFSNIAEQMTTNILKFIVLRQLSVQFYNLKKHFDLGQNAFSFNNWTDFYQEKERIEKFKDIIFKNEPRFEKAKGEYHKLLKYFSNINPNTPSLRGIYKLLNQNFIVSEYNSIFAVSAAAAEIKRLWQKITKDYNPKIKYQKQFNFKYKAELLLLDFVVTYYQLNCLLIDDFHRQEYFQKMSKLDLILEYQPIQLDASDLQQMEQKLKQLSSTT